MVLEMHCPYCRHAETKVVDKRDVESETRRRRECLSCSRRFSTREALEHAELRVIKKDGRREHFDREKLKRGMLRACEKRPISMVKIDSMVARIEQHLQKRGKEIEAKFIGDLVARELKKIDKVAYIRFASVYKEFADISDFKKEIRGLLG